MKVKWDDSGVKKSHEMEDSVLIASKWYEGRKGEAGLANSE